jgi:ABC-type nitrate/sulfonate/bicarbonate transport system substrate-binding protein
VWFTRCPVPNAVGLALRAGKFHQEFVSQPEIRLRSVLDSSDSSVHDAHYYGTLPNALRLGGNVPPIWARSRGADTRLIGIAWTTAPATILARRELGLRTVADLKGKRLLVVRRPDDEIDFPYAGALRSYETALATAGLTLRDVVLVEKQAGASSEHSKPASGSNGGEAHARGGGHKRTLLPLLLGEVDAIFAHGPSAIDLAKGFDLQVVYDLTTQSDPIQQFHNSVPRILTADAGLIDHHFDLLTRILAVLLEVPGWAAENIDDAVHFTALEQSVADHLVTAAYGSRLAPELELNLAEINVARIAAQKAFLLRHGFIAEDFNLDSWIDARPLEAARVLIEERRRLGGLPALSSSRPKIKVGPAGCVSR